MLLIKPSSPDKHYIMSTYQKRSIDEAHPDEGNSLLSSETPDEGKPKEDTQRILKAISVLFMASFALDYALRGSTVSQELFSEASLLSTQTDPFESRYVPLSSTDGFVPFLQGRCFGKRRHVVSRTQETSEKNCAMACKDADDCSSSFFSYDHSAKVNNCIHYDPLIGCDDYDRPRWTSFKFVEYGKCDIGYDKEMELAGSESINSLQDCESLCTNTFECRSYQWYDNGVPVIKSPPGMPPGFPEPSRSKCVLYSEPVVKELIHDTTCYKQEAGKMVEVGPGWCMLDRQEGGGGASNVDLKYCENKLLNGGRKFMEFTTRGNNSCFYGGKDGQGPPPSRVAVAVCANKQSSFTYDMIKN